MAITDDGRFRSDKGVQGREGEDDVEGTEVGMVSRVGVASEDFRKQVLGYGLTTAHILYRMPDHRSLLHRFNLTSSRFRAQNKKFECRERGAFHWSYQSRCGYK